MAVAPLQGPMGNPAAAPPGTSPVPTSALIAFLAEAAANDPAVADQLATILAEQGTPATLDSLQLGLGSLATSTTPVVGSMEQPAQGQTVAGTGLPEGTPPVEQTKTPVPVPETPEEGPNIVNMLAALGAVQSQARPETIASAPAPVRSAAFNPELSQFLASLTAPQAAPALPSLAQLIGGIR